MEDETTALEALRAGGKRALARVLARLESAVQGPDVADLLDAAAAQPKGFSLGLTGPPGVGKSTLIDALIRGWRAGGRTVAVIAVDPSSARSGGALLGDRTRLATDPADSAVFVRSMAARDRLGGLAEATFPAMTLMRALYDLVIVETVGVGQSETEIADTTDLVGYCAQPGAGDALQYMKAGVMEVPDLVIVTKADTGAAARRTASDLRGALSLSAGPEASAEPVPVLSCSAVDGSGIDTVLQEICKIADRMSPRFAEHRAVQLRHWAETAIRTRFGTEGRALVENQLLGTISDRPFRDILAQQERLSAALAAAFL